MGQFPDYIEDSRNGEEGFIPVSLMLKNPDYITCLRNIRSSVLKIWRTEPIIQHYTDHTEEHSYRIIDILGRLLYENCSLLSDDERFILLSSALLHDIGMQSSIYAGLETKDQYSKEEQEQIRSRHNEASYKWIIDSLNSNEAFPLGLDQCKNVAELIAQVCRYHRQLNLLDLEDKTFAGKKIRIRLLAALLRLGDELDADYRRAPLDVLKFRDIPINSKYHWWAHHYVGSINIDDGKITITFRIPSMYKGSNIIYALTENIRISVERQRKDVYKILWDCGLKLYEEIECYEDYSEIQEEIPKDLENHINGLLSKKKIWDDLSKRFSLASDASSLVFSKNENFIKTLDRIFCLIIDDKISEAIEEIENFKFVMMVSMERQIIYFLGGKLKDMIKDRINARTYFELSSIESLKELRSKGEEAETNQQYVDEKEKKVFVIYENDGNLTQSIFSFLREINLEPIRFKEECRFDEAQAIVVLLTGDKEYIKQDNYGNHSIRHAIQPADFKLHLGIALGRASVKPNKVIFVQQERLSLPNKIRFIGFDKIPVIGFDKSSKARIVLAGRLIEAGCDVANSNLTVEKYD